jgi:hypothetical protein
MANRLSTAATPAFASVRQQAKWMLAQRSSKHLKLPDQKGHFLDRLRKSRADRRDESMGFALTLAEQFAADAALQTDEKACAALQAISSIVGEHHTGLRSDVRAKDIAAHLKVLVERCEALESGTARAMAKAHARAFDALKARATTADSAGWNRRAQAFLFGGPQIAGVRSAWAIATESLSYLKSRVDVATQTAPAHGVADQLLALQLVEGFASFDKGCLKDAYQAPSPQAEAGRAARLRQGKAALKGIETLMTRALRDASALRTAQIACVLELAGTEAPSKEHIESFQALCTQQVALFEKSVAALSALAAALMQPSRLNGVPERDTLIIRRMGEALRAFANAMVSEQVDEVQAYVLAHAGQRHPQAVLEALRTTWTEAVAAASAQLGEAQAHLVLVERIAAERALEAEAATRPLRAVRARVDEARALQAKPVAPAPIGTAVGALPHWKAPSARAPQPSLEPLSPLPRLSRKRQRM